MSSSTITLVLAEGTTSPSPILQAVASAPPMVQNSEKQQTVWTVNPQDTEPVLLFYVYPRCEQENTAIDTHNTPKTHNSIKGINMKNDIPKPWGKMPSIRQPENLTIL
jgi:hypothetical protein